MRLLLALALILSPLVARAEVTIQQVTSPGGIEAWLVNEPSIPFLALEIRIRGGSNLDAPGQRGATNLMMALIEEGAADMDARAFQEAREGLAASFSFEAWDDAVAISAQMLTENRDQAVDLLRAALITPRFDQDAIDRVRSQVQSIIAQDAVDPDSIAGDTFFAAAFPGHPYGSDRNGTAESLAALTRDDILAAHRNALVRDRIYVGAVGDISADELGLLLDRLLGDLPTGGPALPGDFPYQMPGGLTVVDFATPQSVAFFGQRGIDRDDPDFFAAHILNHILGGGSFESRLMQEVREERGLTYGIGTYLVSRDHSDMILGSVASSNETVAEAIEVIRAEWARMAEAGVTAEELATAKTYITGEYPLRFDGNAAIAEILVGMQMIGLPPDYVLNRNSYIEAVTLEEINRVASELLDPAGLHFVVVGQPGLIAKAGVPVPCGRTDRRSRQAAKARTSAKGRSPNRRPDPSWGRGRRGSGLISIIEGAAGLNPAWTERQQGLVPQDGSLAWRPLRSCRGPGDLGAGQDGRPRPCHKTSPQEPEQGPGRPRQMRGAGPRGSASALDSRLARSGRQAGPLQRQPQI
jgi:zinc protease